MDKRAEITLPSGLSGVVRAWKTGDLSQALSSVAYRKAPGPAMENALLRQAWVETTDRGPYAFEGPRPPWMQDILEGDLLDALRRVRILTWGPEMDVDFRCLDMRCRERIPRTVDLESLKVKKLTEEGLAIYANNNSANFTLPDCGKELVYSLSTGRTATKAGKLAKEHGARDVVSLASRIRKIEGVESPSHFVRFVDNLSVEDSTALEDVVDEHNCGLETGIDLVCGAVGCELEQSQDVPFGVAFYYPSRVKAGTLVA